MRVPTWGGEGKGRASCMSAHAPWLVRAFFCLLWCVLNSNMYVGMYSAAWRGMSRQTPCPCPSRVSPSLSMLSQRPVCCATPCLPCRPERRGPPLFRPLCACGAHDALSARSRFLPSRPLWPPFCVAARSTPSRALGPRPVPSTKTGRGTWVALCTHPSWRTADGPAGTGWAGTPTTERIASLNPGPSTRLCQRATALRAAVRSAGPPARPSVLPSFNLLPQRSCPLRSALGRTPHTRTSYNFAHAPPTSHLCLGH